MKRLTVDELAKEIGCDANNIRQTFTEYNEAVKTKKDKYDRK